jgi:hypothetical protein
VNTGAGHFVTSCVAISFSKTTFLNGVHFVSLLTSAMQKKKKKNSPSGSNTSASQSKHFQCFMELETSLLFVSTGPTKHCVFTHTVVSVKTFWPRDFLEVQFDISSSCHALHRPLFRLILLSDPAETNYFMTFSNSRLPWTELLRAQAARHDTHFGEGLLRTRQQTSFRKRCACVLYWKTYVIISLTW